MRCRSVEVVDFPLVPVTPRIVFGQRSTNSRISVVTGTPAALAAARYLFVGGRAGEVTTRSAPVKSSSRCSPRRNSPGSPSSFFTDSASLSAGSLSVTSTRLAPCSTSHRVTAIPPPNRPRPATVTRLFRTSVINCAMLPVDRPGDTMIHMTIRAHFDGKVIVPDEPVSLPAGTPLTIRVEPEQFVPAEHATLEQRKAAFESFIARARARPVPSLTDEQIAPDTIYED